LCGERVGRHDQRAIQVHGGLLLCLLPLLVKVMLPGQVEPKWPQSCKHDTLCASILPEQYSRSQRHWYQQGDGSKQEEWKKITLSFHVSLLFSCVSGTRELRSKITLRPAAQFAFALQLFIRNWLIRAPKASP